MIYLQLFWEFLKIGIFAVGGGMATLPFLQALAEKTGWYTSSLISDMIAISESTPGPIGINMATYVGYNVGGIPGGLIATLGETVPAIIIVIAVSKSLERFRKNPLVEAAFYGLRPAVCGLIAAAGLSVAKSAFMPDGELALNFLTWGRILWFVLAFIAIHKFKLHPVTCIAVSAVVGLVLGL